MSQLPRIAVTMGDPAGIGPEVCLHLFNDSNIARQCTPVVFGDAEILQRVSAAASLPLSAPVIGPQQWQTDWAAIAAPAIVDWRAVESEHVQPGVVSATTGRAGFTYVERAIDAALAGHVAAVSTAPLNKEALNAAGVRFPGHTEIFAARTNAPRSCMMQYSEEITCTFVTVHVGYHEVPGLLTTDRILDVIELTRSEERRVGKRCVRLVSAGLVEC